MSKYIYISSLHNLNIAADILTNRAIDHRINNAALRTRFYAQHARCPYNGYAINHNRHCFQIQFVIKEIEFKTLPSIFKNKAVISHIFTLLHLPIITRFYFLLEP